MSTDKIDPKNTTEPSVKITKLPDEQEIPDEELEKATGGVMDKTNNPTSASVSVCLVKN